MVRRRRAARLWHAGIHAAALGSVYLVKNDLHVVAAGNEFDWIKAHFVGGPATCAKQ